MQNYAINVVVYMVYEDYLIIVFDGYNVTGWKAGKTPQGIF